LEGQKLNAPLNMPRRLFIATDGKAADPAADKRRPEAQKAIAEATAMAVLPRLEPEMQLVLVHGPQVAAAQCHCARACGAAVTG
jgi:carbamate kinase